MGPIVQILFRRPIQIQSKARIGLVFDNFHLLRASGTYEYPEHRHSDYELILVKEGPYLCQLNTVELSVPTGGVLVIKPGDTHQDHFRKGDAITCLHFRIIPGLEVSSELALFRKQCAPASQVCAGNHLCDATLLEALQHESEEGAK